WQESPTGGGRGGAARKRRIRGCGGGGRAGSGMGPARGGVLCDGGSAARFGANAGGAAGTRGVQATETLCADRGLATQCTGQAEPRGIACGAEITDGRWSVLLPRA